MALKLSAGDFKKKVHIRKYGEAQNSEGGVEGGSVLIHIVTFAAVRKWDQKRVLEAGQADLLNTQLIYIRYSNERATIGEGNLKDWRIEIDGKEYNLFSRPVLIESGLKVFEITVKGK
jgi:SPP1 family predicted phage head-tail adaptor